METNTVDTKDSNTSETNSQETKLETINLETNMPTITKTTIICPFCSLSFGRNYDIVYNDGRQTSPSSLVPGDILIKRGNGEWENTLRQFPQTFLNRDFEAVYERVSLLSHSAIYIGNREIAEATSEGTVKHSLEDYKAYDWHVIRVKDDHIRNEIVSLARQCLGTRELGTYGHVLHSVGLNLEAWQKFYELQRGEALALNSVEFVVFCIAAACFKLGRNKIVKRSESNITPAELYIELRDNHNDYEYIGKILRNWL